MLESAQRITHGDPPSSQTRRHRHYPRRLSNLASRPNRLGPTWQAQSPLKPCHHTLCGACFLQQHLAAKRVHSECFCDSFSAHSGAALDAGFRLADGRLLA